MKTYDSGFLGKKKRVSKKEKGGVDHIRRMVASMGNEKIQRMLSDNSALFKKNLDPMGRSIFNKIQPKLEISQPQDAAEVQADKVAEGVTQGDTKISKAALTHAPASEINAKSEGSGTQTTDAFDSQLQSTKGQGQKLDNTTKTELEQHTGSDLSGVNIHTSSKAGELSENINAKAFTHGQDIYFNSGNYNPQSNEGKQLLAHEVAHTVQQGNGLSRMIQRSMKFEIETKNFIWKVDTQGNPSYVKRKFGEYGEVTESGDKSAYLTTGEHGLKVGQSYFKEIKGPAIMQEKKIKKENKDKEAQIIREYRFIKDVKLTKFAGYTAPADVIKKPAGGMIKLTKKANNANVSEKSGKYIPNTFQNIYYTSTGIVALDIHVDSKGLFQLGKKGIMEVDRSSAPVDMNKKAQFYIIYQFKEGIQDEKDVIGKNIPGDLVGKNISDNQVTPVKFIDLKKTKADPKTYHPNIYHIEYFTKDLKRLSVHRDEDGIFRKGIPQYMELVVHGTLSNKERKVMKDENKSAQYEEKWKIIKNSRGGYDYFGEKVNVEMVEHKDNDKPAMKGKFLPGTFDRKFYMAEDFSSGAKLKPNAKALEVYRDENGNFKKGTKILKGDQTAMELQSENHGYLEFETPNWFRSWEELKLRVEDAVNVTKILSTEGRKVTELTHPGLLAKMKARKKLNDVDSTEPLGEVREWPSSILNIKHLKQQLKGKKLFIELAKPDWDAFFQTSESIRLSDFSSLAEHYSLWEGGEQDKIFKYANTYASYILSSAKNKSDFKTLNDSLFADLKGFLQLIISYIISGQYYYAGGSKKTFDIMARNNFGDMYLKLLSKDERELFKLMVQSKTEKWFFAETFENNINILRRDRPRDPSYSNAIDAMIRKKITLNTNTSFFISQSAVNPKISSWLNAILEGKDLLEGSAQNVSDAMAGKELKLKPDNKDYKMAMFEIRKDVPVKAAQWVTQAQILFNNAMKRSLDTPDDPSTGSETETSKTSLKD